MVNTRNTGNTRERERERERERVRIFDSLVEAWAMRCLSRRARMSSQTPLLVMDVLWCGVV